MPETRKVAAILVADIVGYSRLAGAEEERTLARLRSLRSDLIDPTIAIHNGRLVKRTGDGAVVEFRSVVEAVRAAIDVQSGLADRNAGVPAGQRIEVRVGIHLGDVVEEADGDLMGDGVNVAARLQAICQSGGICLSGAAYEQVRDKLQVTFADLGEQNLKNIARPVRAYAVKLGAAASAPAMPHKVRNKVLVWSALAAALVAVLIAAGWFGLRRYAPPALAPAPVAAVADEKLAHAPRLSIVVLPFTNLSGDPEQDYFADGLTDDLTTDLSHIADSFVIGRSTAATYKGKSVDLKQLGRDLGVRYALEGSVRRVGETITVNAQLVSTETGAHLWADRFEGERAKLGELQVGAVSRIANALGVQLINAEALRAIRERPTNPDAADYVMRGSAAWWRGYTPNSFAEAIDDYNKALRLDPTNEQALARKATVEVIGLLDLGIGRERFDEVIWEAEAEIDRAIALQPNDPLAHSIKGVIAQATGRYDLWLAEINTAIALDRNFASAYGEKGSYMIAHGRAAEAFDLIDKALQLDPQDPSLYIWQWFACNAHAHLAQWEQAIDWCQRSAATNPSTFWPYYELAASYGWLGRNADAANTVSELRKRRPEASAQDYRRMQGYSDPQFVRERDRIVEGLLKAGLPESAAAPVVAGPKNWCTGVNIVAIVGWPVGSGDFASDRLYNGYRRAEFDLGPSVRYAYGHWDPADTLAELRRAVELKADGVAVQGELLPEDAATVALIDKAFEQGTIVMTAGEAMPLSESKHSSEGMGYVGASNRQVFAFVNEAIRRAGLKTGDKVLLWMWGNLGESEASRGAADALEKAGLKVAYLKLERGDWGSGIVARFAGVLKGNPDLKAVIIADTGVTAHIAYSARMYGLKPGQLFIAGVDLLPTTVQGIKDGYVNLVLDDQKFLQGYLPILNICLTKKDGFSGLRFNPAILYIDASNVEAIAPLLEKEIR